MSPSSLTARGGAVKIIAGVLLEKHSLSTMLAERLPTLASEQRPLAQELSYGVLRWYNSLEDIANKLLQKPLTGKKRIVHFLLLTGLYQIIYLKIPSHAAVHETVSESRRLQQAWASGLINALLRNFIRQQQTLSPPDNMKTLQRNHPEWLLKILQSDWPSLWETIITANQQHPSLSLRINIQNTNMQSYLGQLQAAELDYSLCEHSPEHAIHLKQAVSTNKLPNFTEGHVSVQDCAAQLAAKLLAPEAGHKVLDACAAPGGKSCHLLEYQKNIQLTALDIVPQRLQKIHQNLQRLKLSAQVIAGDASDPQHPWWDKQAFDRILLDAPCSASGVIRRHPDIKFLRRKEDIQTIQQLQKSILHALWPLLKPGGILLYATCSVIRAENDQQIASFLAHQNDAIEHIIHASWGHAMPFGRQILPGEQDMDGFYYALLSKRSV